MVKWNDAAISANKLEVATPELLGFSQSSDFKILATAASVEEGSAG
jgi:hypothetical protein